MLVDLRPCNANLPPATCWQRLPTIQVNHLRFLNFFGTHPLRSLIELSRSTTSDFWNFWHTSFAFVIAVVILLVFLHHYKLLYFWGVWRYKICQIWQVCQKRILCTLGMYLHLRVGKDLPARASHNIISCKGSNCGQLRHAPCLERQVKFLDSMELPARNLSELCRWRLLEELKY